MDRPEPTADEMIRFVMGDTTKLTPEQALYLEEMKVGVQAEVMEIYERVKREVDGSKSPDLGQSG